MKKLAILAIAVNLALIGAAKAHEGPRLLTTSEDNRRVAQSDGVTLEESNGVHLWRGARVLDGASPDSGPDDFLYAEPAPTLIVIDNRRILARSFRRLRTQGFYSGVPYPSRQFTTGFYSGSR